MTNGSANVERDATATRALLTFRPWLARHHVRMAWIVCGDAMLVPQMIDGREAFFC